MDRRAAAIGFSGHRSATDVDHTIAGASSTRARFAHRHRVQRREVVSRTSLESSRSTQYQTVALASAPQPPAGGIRSYLSPIGRTRSEAEAWIESRRQDLLFSFHVVCPNFGPGTERGTPCLEAFARQERDAAHDARAQPSQRSSRRASLVARHRLSGDTTASYLVKTFSLALIDLRRSSCSIASVDEPTYPGVLEPERRRTFSSRGLRLNALEWGDPAAPNSCWHTGGGITRGALRCWLRCWPSASA